MARKKVWLVGPGIMGLEYFPVLGALECDVTVIGRSHRSAAAFQEKTGHDVFSGGLAAFLADARELPDAAIVAVDVDALAEAARLLVAHGVKNILLEKPGGASVSEIKGLALFCVRAGVDIPLAYNRRFFASVNTARKMISDDGGARSFCFEFTEWGHEIEGLRKSEKVLANWFLANSSHVADLAFFLGGDPKEICCHAKGSLAWHPAGSIFTGAGVSVGGLPFSYHADWEAPGRWGVEVMTAKRRYIFRPMEKLHVQAKGTVAIEPVELDDGRLDVDFKPGLFLQTKSFLEGKWDCFRMLSSQGVLVDVYGRIAGYAENPSPCH